MISMHGNSCWQLCRAKPEASEEDRKREAVRAQLEEITQEYKAAQEQARSAAQQLKCASTQMHGCVLGLLPTQKNWWRSVPLSHCH